MSLKAAYPTSDNIVRNTKASVLAVQYLPVSRAGIRLPFRARRVEDDEKTVEDGIRSRYSEISFLVCPESWPLSSHSDIKYPRGNYNEM